MGKSFGEWANEADREAFGHAARQMTEAGSVILKYTAVRLNHPEAVRVFQEAADNLTEIWGRYVEETGNADGAEIYNACRDLLLEDELWSPLDILWESGIYSRQDPGEE